jgi:hypothetical protein
MNSQLVSVIEKKNNNPIPADFNNMISKSSATAKHFGAFQRWKLFKCKVC